MLDLWEGAVSYERGSPVRLEQVEIALSQTGLVRSREIGLTTLRLTPTLTAFVPYTRDVNV